MRTKWWIGVLFGLHWGCGACDESVVEEVPVDETPVTGGAESAMDLSTQWFEGLGTGERSVVDRLILGSEFIGEIFDCTVAEEPEEFAERYEELGHRLRAELDTSASGETNFELMNARSLQSQSYGEGSTFDDCLVNRAMERHRISSLVRLTEGSEEPRVERRFVAAWVFDGHWFLAGVPGSLVPASGTPRMAEPDRVPTIGPSPERRAPLRVRPPREHENPNPPERTPPTSESTP